MANELAQGSYYIRTQATDGDGDVLYLTTTSDKLTDGDNVSLAKDADGIGQEWFVDYIKTVDGQRIYEIRNRWSCKNLDVAYDDYVKEGVPCNVQIYSDQNKAWQRWNVADTGLTKKVDGVAYPVYAVYSRVDGTGTQYMLDAKGKAAGSNVQIGKGDLDTTRRWIFVPMPKFKAGQIYEVRSMLAPKKLALATQKGATANGSNVFIDGLDQTSNAQKWAFVKDGSSWLIRNIASGKYLDVKANSVADFANGLNAQVYKQGGKATDDTLKWVVNVADETQSIGGVDRAIVGLKPGGDADGKYALDVESAHKASGANVQIYEANATQAQRWCLVKTDATDPNMPAPTSIHLAKTLGGGGYQTIDQGKAHYIAWKCADSWVTGANSNGYKLRWRVRDMAPHTSAWGDWGDWKTWRWVAPYAQSSRYWYTKSLDFAYTWAEAKNRQVEVQLVAQTAYGESTVTSEKADQVINLSRCPSATIKDCAWSYDGLHVTMESDYNGYGKVRINLKKLVFTTRKGAKLSALKKSVSVMAKRASRDLMSFTIPESYLTGNPKEGSEASFRFTVGSDQYDELSDDVTQTATVSYESGTDEGMTVAVTDTKSLMKKVVVNRANTVRCWVKLGTTATELSGKVNDGGETVFTYAYPFGTDYEFFISYTDDDDTATWAVATEEIDGSEGIRAHVWNWDDGYLVLWLNTETVSESRSYSTEAETHVLSGREHPVVSFLASHGGRNFTSVTSTVEGVLLADDKYGCTVDDVEELLAEGHVTYRSPNGRIATVAVTGADVTQRKQFSTVSIEQTEEQL